jgi:hypothetical protein
MHACSWPQLLLVMCPRPACTPVGTPHTHATAQRAPAACRVRHIVQPGCASCLSHVHTCAGAATPAAAPTAPPAPPPPPPQPPPPTKRTHHVADDERERAGEHNLVAGGYGVPPGLVRLQQARQRPRQLHARLLLQLLARAALLHRLVRPQRHIAAPAHRPLLWRGAAGRPGLPHQPHRARGAELAWVLGCSENPDNSRPPPHLALRAPVAAQRCVLRQLHVASCQRGGWHRVACATKSPVWRHNHHCGECGRVVRCGLHHGLVHP